MRTTDEAGPTKGYLTGLLPDLVGRVRVPELMDDPDLDRDLHEAALDALTRINKVSGVAGRVWHEARELHAETGAPVRIFDVACGRGDVLMAVAMRAKGAGVPVEVAGCDISPYAVESAQASFDERGVSGAFFVLDALGDPLPKDYDLITCSLFLHHLDESDAIELLRLMAEAARHTLLVQDLRRTRLGYLLALVALHALTRSSIARVDGLRSVRGAFTAKEALDVCRQAGLTGVEISVGWPQRFIAKWRRT